jgi:hypothetical protein
MQRFSLLVLLLTGCFGAHAFGQHAQVTCASCHSSEAFSQPETQMGRAMQVPGHNAVLSAHPVLSFRSGPYVYSVETRNGQSRYSVSDGKQILSLPILWAMGAEAQTWILERDGRMYESMVSYYPMLKGLFTTVGDEKMAPKSLEEAIGRPLSDEDAKTCFSCHSTNAIVDHKLNLSSLTPGLTCEHCHVGSMEHLKNAAAHLKNAATGDSDPGMKSLSDMSTEDFSDFCGSCHRTWELVTRAGWRGTSNVRFQPYRLANSKCYDGADPRISCVACHDPHRQVVRDTAYYDSKCLACHTTPAQAHAKVCPVAKTNCSSCHMPKTPFPGGHFVFTDHQIRVVKPNEPYPN